MFQRDIIRALEKWLKKKGRKPLVIQGARQVGKTTAVEHFARNFKQYICMNAKVGCEFRNSLLCNELQNSN